MFWLKNIFQTFNQIKMQLINIHHLLSGMLKFVCMERSITQSRGGKYFLFPDAQIAVVIKTSTGKK